MECIPNNIDRAHLGVRHFGALLISRLILLTPHGQARVGRRGSDQRDDHGITDQRLTAPVHRDEREQTMFDFVPLAGARRQMVYHDIDPEFV